MQHVAELCNMVLSGFHVFDIFEGGFGPDHCFPVLDQHHEEEGYDYCYAGIDEKETVAQPVFQETEQNGTYNGGKHGEEVVISRILANPLV